MKLGKSARVKRWPSLPQLTSQGGREHKSMQRLLRVGSLQQVPGRQGAPEVARIKPRRKETDVHISQLPKSLERDRSLCSAGSWYREQSRGTQPLLPSGRDQLVSAILYPCMKP